MGKKFIIELQKPKQNYFKNRTVFYSTFPIREQAEADSRDSALKAVYCVRILDFVFKDPASGSEGEVLHGVKLKNQYDAVFYDKLTYWRQSKSGSSTDGSFKSHRDEINTVQTAR